MRQRSDLVLTLAVNSVFVVSFFSQDPHRNTTVLVNQRVVVRRVQHGNWPIFVAASRSRDEVWSIRHGVLSSGHDHVGIPQGNETRRINHGGGSRKTYLIDGDAVHEI